MKTIKAGAAPWFVGLVIKCGGCHWEGEFEAKDKDAPEFSAYCHLEVKWVCPNCGNHLSKMPL
jgi:hypothetical protein